MKLAWLSPNTVEWEQSIPLISNVPWQAGSHLARQMQHKHWLDWEGVLSLWDGETLVGFCALLQEDLLKNSDLTPFIGVVFVAEKYRGHRFSETLVYEAEQRARSYDFAQAYIVTQHVGLYEKYGYQKIAESEDIFNRPVNVYRKNLSS